MSRRRRKKNKGTPQTEASTDTGTEPIDAVATSSGQEAAVNVVSAARHGFAAAHAEASTVNPEDLRQALLFTIPGEWVDDDARAMLERLSGDELTTVLSWLSLNWHQGYGAGYVDGSNGEPPIAEALDSGHSALAE